MPSIKIVRANVTTNSDNWFRSIENLMDSTKKKLNLALWNPKRLSYKTREMVEERNLLVLTPNENTQKGPSTTDMLKTFVKNIK